MGRVLPPLIGLLAAALAIAGVGGMAQADTNWTMRVRAVGDYLLAQQTAHGCIPDAPGGLRANQDAAMAYALVTFAHAYRVTSADRFRRGLRSGIEWLAATVEKRERPWVGSWRHAYSAKPPYVALPTSPAENVEDGRGGTANAALFAYLVYLYGEVAPDRSFVLKMRPYVRAALDFLLERNLAENHLFYTGWYRIRGTGRWELYRMQVATDQAAAYLGLRAGQRLLAHRRYGVAADRLAREIDVLYHKESRAFAVARDPGGKLIPPADDCESYLTQGYLAWVFGHQRETKDAIQWLQDRHAPDGTFRRKRTDVPYIQPALAFCLGARRLGLYPSDRGQIKRWLRTYALTPQHAIREALVPNPATPSHLTGWFTLAVLDADPLPRRERDPTP